MGLERIELSTPALSEQCSNQLSYRPKESIPFFLKKGLMCVTGSGQSLCFRSFVRAEKPPIDRILHRKEVIQPHLPIQLPCYDLAPINSLTFGALFLAVREATSGTAIFHGLTGGVYKARERIHRGMLIRDY